MKKIKKLIGSVQILSLNDFHTEVKNHENKEEQFYKTKPKYISSIL